MADWLTEVCSCLKSSARTYFLTLTIIDKYLTACHQFGKVMENRDIHKIGIGAYYLASKYEDVYFLHSKMIGEKMGHGQVTSEDIKDTERDILQIFEFEMNFVTHFDFYQTYKSKIEKQVNHNLKQAGDDVSKEYHTFCQELL